MQTQYTVTLGASSKDPTAKKCWKDNRFDEQDSKTLIKILLERGFPGATILKGTGMWQGRVEEAFVISILADDYSKVKAFANQLRPSFKQQSIMICQSGCGEFFGRKKSPVSKKARPSSAAGTMPLGKINHR